MESSCTVYELRCNECGKSYRQSPAVGLPGLPGAP